MNLEFNEELVRSIPPEHRGLAKLLLLSIYCDLNLWNFVDPNGSKLELREHLIDISNSIAAKLIHEDTLVPDYSGESRLSIEKPLFIPLGITTNIDDVVDRVRSYFKSSYSGVKGYSSDHATVKEFIEKHRVSNPTTNLENIPKATKAYVDYTKKCNGYLKKLENWIVQDLSTWLGELEEEGITKHKVGRTLI